MKRIGFLSPLVYLSSNTLSLAGVVIVTSATVLWLALLPSSLGGELSHPYLGILAFLILPGVFLAGLALIPAGIILRRRREQRRGKLPSSFAPLDVHNVEFRRLLFFVGVTTFANVLIAGQFSYKAVEYMDSVAFCGLTCHTVMKPEFTAYQNSPHSRVECVKCHIGPGATWFVRSKLSGIRQVFAVAFNTHPRPIPTPVADLRPARETCETCHWPQKFGADRVRVITRFGDDESNSVSKTVLLMRIGAGQGSRGIHAAHLAEGVSIRYAHSDPRRQTIPWVEHRDRSGRTTVFQTSDLKSGASGLTIREMDCMDCHTRPTHAFEMPERAADRALAAGDLSPSLPFARKKGVEILKATYGTTADAVRQIPEAFERFYRETYPAVYSARKADVQRSAKALLALYERNVFPEMKIEWGTYPDHIGHTDFPGCFRCHDDSHLASEGRKIPQDCSACHSMLAVEEPAPKILEDLGISGAK